MMYLESMVPIITYLVLFVNGLFTIYDYRLDPMEAIYVHLRVGWE